MGRVYSLMGSAGAPAIITVIEGHRAQRFFFRADLFVFAYRWPWFMYACIGVAVGLLLVAVLFLIVATVSAKCTASRPFVSSRRLRCLRATNCVVRPIASSNFHSLGT